MRLLGKFIGWGISVVGEIFEHVVVGIIKGISEYQSKHDHSDQKKHD